MCSLAVGAGGFGDRLGSTHRLGFPQLRWSVVSSLGPPRAPLDLGSGPCKEAGLCVKSCRFGSWLRLAWGGERRPVGAGVQRYLVWC